MHVLLLYIMYYSAVTLSLYLHTHCHPVSVGCIKISCITMEGVKTTGSISTILK